MVAMLDLRSLPKVDVLSRHELLAPYPERVRVAAAREGIERARAGLLAGREVDVYAEASRAAEVFMAFTTRNAINMTGVVLHTGLGRARLAPTVAAHLAEVASGHSVVEFDLEDGTRGDRQNHVRSLLCDLTGAEDAFVVNNAAAGVFLTLKALAEDSEVLLSRGQMVEIGGSFRMPDIVRESGCHLVEVGCTNKTKVSDYAERLSEDTGAILRCHPSNYKIVGFTDEPELGELVDLADAYGVWLIDDQGTGCLVDLARFGMQRVPTVPASVQAGSDVVIASCDKLLGGPQGGMILGQTEAIEAIKQHPLARACRVDKLTLAALEATLRLYTTGREMEIPTLRYLGRELAEVEEMARRLASVVPGSIVEPALSEVGGGSAPGTDVPTWRVGLAAENELEIAQFMRTGHPPIIGRIEKGRLWLDPRTVDDDDLTVVEARLKDVCNGR
jgi:L-seryl-tRNA(Ser) seleniumtransferase